MISQIFEPFGFVQPFLLPVKILLQELSISGLGWDDEIADKERIVWE